VQLMSIAQGYGKKVVSLLTNMDQPLGRFAGNSLEVEECVAIMKGETFAGPSGYDLYHDTRELSLWLSAQMIFMAGRTKSAQEGYDLALDILNTGQALKKFELLCQIHGGDLSALPRPKQKVVVLAETSGFVQAFNTEAIGVAGIIIKAGRAQTSDIIVPTSGIEFHLKVGDAVQAGDILYTIHGDDLELLKTAVPMLSTSVTISLQKTITPSLILKTLQ
ncbi:MAG: thymidine phosphorylase, partial [Proteobacteria bacterium]